MFGGGDDDDDFTIADGDGNRKLASLFGGGRVASGDANEGGNSASLKYSAPKQPKPRAASSVTAKNASAGGVMIACPVHAYRYVDNQAVSEGQLGAAVVSAPDNHYRILLYKSNKQSVATAPIQAETPNIAIQNGNYVQFTDSSHVSWSLSTESPSEAVRFCAHVALAQALSDSDGDLADLHVMELRQGEGSAVTARDGIEVKYSGWLVQGQTLSRQPFDSNEEKETFFRVKIIQKATIIPGWIEGLVGMRREGRRILVIPSSLAYGQRGTGDGSIPADSALVFHLQAGKVKLNEKSSAKVSKDSRGRSLSFQSDVPDLPTLPILDDVTSVHDDTASDASRDDLSRERRASSATPEDTGKTSLLSRMAKMGQAMLPTPTPNEGGGGQEKTDVEQMNKQGTANLNQANEQMMHSTSGFVPMNQSSMAPIMIMTPQGVVPAPGLMHQPQMMTNQLQTQNLMTANHFSPAASSQALTPYQPLLQQQMFNAPLQAGGQPFPSTPPRPPNSATPPLASSHYAPGASAVDSALAPILISETRQQNTEVRMTLAKVLDKIEDIGKSITAMERGGGAGPLSLAPAMESSVLQQNLNRILDENASMKQSLLMKGEKVEELNKRIGEILLENQSFVEKSHERLAARNSSLASSSAATLTYAQSRVLILEQEKLELTQKLGDTVAELASSQSHQQEAAQKLIKFEKQSKDNETKSEDFEKELTEKRRRLKELEVETEKMGGERKKEEKEGKRKSDQVAGLKEEVAELTTSNEQLKSLLADRKSKMVQEREKAEAEEEALKKGNERSLEELRMQIRKERSNTDATTSQQISTIEKQLEEEFREKARRQLKQMKTKHETEVQEMEEDKKMREEVIEAAKVKVSQLKEALIALRQQNQELVDETEQVEVWQEKYKKLYKNVGILKERYEEKLSEGEKEKKDLFEKVFTLTRQVDEKPSAAQDQNFKVHVKSILNRTYHEIRREVDAQQSYAGDVVHQLLLQTIKRVTMETLEQTEETAAGATAMGKTAEENGTIDGAAAILADDEAALSTATTAGPPPHYAPSAAAPESPSVGRKSSGSREEANRVAGVAKAAAYVKSLGEEEERTEGQDHCESTIINLGQRPKSGSYESYSSSGSFETAITEATNGEGDKKPSEDVAARLEQCTHSIKEEPLEAEGKDRSKTLVGCEEIQPEQPRLQGQLQQEPEEHQLQQSALEGHEDQQQSRPEIMEEQSRPESMEQQPEPRDHQPEHREQEQQLQKEISGSESSVSSWEVVEEKQNELWEEVQHSKEHEDKTTAAAAAFVVPPVDLDAPLQIETPMQTQTTVEEVEVKENVDKEETGIEGFEKGKVEEKNGDATLGNVAAGYAAASDAAADDAAADSVPDLPPFDDLPPLPSDYLSETDLHVTVKTQSGTDMASDNATNRQSKAPREGTPFPADDTLVRSVDLDFENKMRDVTKDVESHDGDVSLEIDPLGGVSVKEESTGYVSRKSSRGDKPSPAPAKRGVPKRPSSDYLGYDDDADAGWNSSGGFAGGGGGGSGSGAAAASSAFAPNEASVVGRSSTDLFSGTDKPRRDSKASLNSSSSKHSSQPKTTSLFGGSDDDDDDDDAALFFTSSSKSRSGSNQSKNSNSGAAGDSTPAVADVSAAGVKVATAAKSDDTKKVSPLSHKPQPPPLLFDDDDDDDLDWLQ